MRRAIKQFYERRQELLRRRAETQAMKDGFFGNAEALDEWSFLDAAEDARSLGLPDTMREALLAEEG